MTDTDVPRSADGRPHDEPPHVVHGEVVPQDWVGLVALTGLMLTIGIFAGWSWVIIIAALVVMIFMHELGHYLTARWSGMKVTEFFIGFGPRVWSFRRGETEYGVKLIWLGAYVRIIGMNNLDEVDPADEARTYRQQSYPKRLLVASAGSGMHFLMAIALVFAVLVIDGRGIDRVDAAAEADGWTLETVSVDSAALAAGLEPGDELVSVGGVEITTFDEFGTLVTGIGGRDVEVVFERDGELLTTRTTIGERLTIDGAEGISGLIERDRILAVDGLDLDRPPTYAEFAAFAADKIGEPLDITIVDARTGEPAVYEGAVVERLVDPTVATSGFFGVSPDYPSDPVGVLPAAGEAVTSVGEAIYEVTVALPRIVSGGLDGAFDGVVGRDEEPTTVSGAARDLELRRLDETNPDENRILSIYGVAAIGASAVEDGLTDVLRLLFVVNIVIGVFNLLPLLPLDGGHVLIATYERIRSIGGRRHRVDAAKLLPLTYAVVLLLVTVGMIALVRDVVDPINL